MKKTCGTCGSRVQYENDPEHYICNAAPVIKRVSATHKVCSKYKNFMKD